MYTRRLLVETGRSLALRRYACLQPIVEIRHLRMGLGQGCGEVVVDSSEILLDQSDLTSKQAGIPLG